MTNSLKRRRLEAERHEAVIQPQSTPSPDGGSKSRDIVGGYQVLFPSLTRAAHRTCLEVARLTRDDRWPTVQDCLNVAPLYGVKPADLAAFFGYLSWAEHGRTIWVDALKGPVPSSVARLHATRGQAVAFGFQCAFGDNIGSVLH